MLSIRKSLVCSLWIFHLCFKLQAAKDVVLAEKPVISDDCDQLDSSLLNDLLANIATISSVYHKRPDAFVSRAKASLPKPDNDDITDGSEAAYSESPSHVTEATPAPGSSSLSSGTDPAPVPDLLGDLIGLDNAIVPVDQAPQPSG